MSTRLEKELALQERLANIAKELRHARKLAEGTGRSSLIGAVAAIERANRSALRYLKTAQRKTLMQTLMGDKS